MASLEPVFRRDPSGNLTLKDSPQVYPIKNEHRERDLAKARLAAVVRREAEQRVKKAGGDINNSKHLLGCFEIQFGQFRGMQFKWILENSPGYAGFLVNGMEKDQAAPTDDRWINKMAFKKYIELWPEGRKIVAMKKKSNAPKISPKIKGVSSTALTTKQEMSDEDLLLATQELEQKMVTDVPASHWSYVTSMTASQMQQYLSSTKEGRVATDCQTSQGVPAVSSRDLFVPTVSTQRKALLSGAHLPVQKPLPATANIQRPTSATATSQKPTSATASTRKPTSATATTQKPTSATASIQKPISATATIKQPTSATATIKQPTSATATIQKPRSATATIQPTSSATSVAQKPSAAIKTSLPVVNTSIAPTPSVMVTSEHITETARKKEVGDALSSSLSSPVSDSDQQLPATQRSVDTQRMGETPSDTTSQQANEGLCLPARWKTTLPKVDQQWIAKALFRWTKTGKAELVPEHLNQLWWYPPQPAVAVNNIPGVDRYFARPLFLWMPRKQWKVKLYCPKPGCDKQELASAGINQKVRQVVDIDGFYNMACDNLECMKCRSRVLSWSHAILSQLDIGHRVQFPCILTAKHACDIKVVRLLRNRGLGNSCSQIRKKLLEQHGEEWYKSLLHYLTDCSGFSSAAELSLLVNPTFTELPERAPLPRHRWLMQIYIQDVLHRLDEMKAGITSVFGRILKIDSTKKVVKKLAGAPARTALWCTNVGNEHGQILTSVMTSGEGHGLSPMLVGVINRYTKAQEKSPEIIYVDRDCCGASPLQEVLTASAWNTVLRLDIWHFMRRIATGCSTDSHQLYSTFMGLLSNCIFAWDEQDLNRLIKSKRNELTAQHLFIKSDADIVKHLSRYELALHCRRTTRGVAETTKLIGELIEMFSGDKGRDTLGVQLINTSRMKSIWDAQKKHIPCLQDPPGVALYTKTGSIKKGGIELPNYRCARGSTSLESFHLHLNRFIPGTLASDVLFQAYMVDGLHRWNEDRARAATSTANDYQPYSGLLRHTANVLGLQVLKRKVDPTFTEPRKYTGELIGIEYLYSQTGKVLEDYMKAIEMLETTQDDETINTGEDDELLQDTNQIDDLTVSTVGVQLKESSDFVLETPDLRPITETAEGPNPSSSTQTQAVRPVLDIPTSEEYESMTREVVGQQTVEPIHRAPTPVVTEESPGEAASEDNDSESESDECVGPDSIPGYDRVQELAAYLVDLRHNIYLTSAQVTRLIQFWNNLTNYDKKPTVFQERYSKEARGRYKAKKSVRNVVPGVESSERAMKGGPGAVPASWPSANRYTEAIILRLFSVLPKKRSRFNDVTKAYYEIRHLVLQNGKVMSETSIQLPEISRGTLTQWYTKHGKAMDKLVVTQGVRFVQPSKTTSQGIPAAVEKPAQLPTGRAEPHSFPLPTNTAGLARFKGQKRKDSHRSQVVTTQSTPAQPTVSPHAPDLTTPQSTPSLAAPLSKHPLDVPLSKHPPSATLPTQSLVVPQSTYPHIASQLTHSLNALQPHPFFAHQYSALVTNPQSSCYIPAQQSTPAGPAQQSAIPVGTTPLAPLQMLTVNTDGRSCQLSQASQAHQLPMPSLSVPPFVPYTTQRYRKRKLENEKQGIVKRKYDRQKIPTCKQCGQDRIPPTHIQYFMNWFCGATSTVSLDDWYDNLMKKGYGKKPKS